MHSRQLSVQASVDEKASHLGHEAAEHREVRELFEHHGLTAHRTAQLGGQRGALGVVERHRGPYACADAILRLVVELAERRDDRLQMVRAAVRGHQRQKILRELGDLEAGGDFRRDRALGGRGDPRPREERVKLRLAGELRRDGVELARDEIDLIALAGELVKSLPVGTGDGGRGLHLVADLGNRLGDDASMIFVAQAPAHELLGDRRRQIGDLATQLVEGAAYVGVHLRLRGLDEPL